MLLCSHLDFATPASLGLDFDAGQKTVMSLQPQDIEQMMRLADFARPTASGAGRSQEEWAAHVTLLSGLGGGPYNETARLPASSPRMAATLLKYRVDKKVLLWEVLLAATAAAAEATPATGSRQYGSRS